MKGSLPASWPGHSDRGKSRVASFGMFWEVFEVSREKRIRRVFLNVCVYVLQGNGGEQELIGSQVRRLQVFPYRSAFPLP